MQRQLNEVETAEHVVSVLHHSASLGHLLLDGVLYLLGQTRRPSRFPIDLPVVLDLIVTVSVVSLVKPLEIPTRRWLPYASKCLTPVMRVASVETRRNPGDVSCFAHDVHFRRTVS